ncbi:hypothetical protein FQN54_007793 [Arachnomyces sp. PD_36]|nr:hypothetical protein FQN54_007793 [Arachnomyces sp. PD_36]
MDQEHARSALNSINEDQQKLWETALKPWESGVLPRSDAMRAARSSLADYLPQTGTGFEETRKHLFNSIIPGLNANSISPNYYGFVTGGTTAAALLADNIVSTYDQNVQVHLPDHSIATDVESCALHMLLDLFHLDRKVWGNGTFTTGATGSNILGLACGREFVVNAAAKKKGSQIGSVGEFGLADALRSAGVSRIQVLSTMPHSSIGKASGVVGIGRANLQNISSGGGQALGIDMEKLEQCLARSDTASIVAISCGEVNTGHFATGGIEDFRKVRELCDKYGAWLHVDGAFGVFGRVLDDGPEFDRIKKGSEGIELADSITGDGHKLLNVPYDCGFFFCRHKGLAEEVFTNPNAAYLSSGGDANSIPSPLNIGMENSRRFRALPVYATLMAYGRDGYRDMLERQIRLGRSIVDWIFDDPRYEALPAASSKQELLDNTFIIVLVRAKDASLNKDLGKKINATSKMFVSGTSWDGNPACRIAISNWRVDVERDSKLVVDVLDTVAGN